MVIIEKLVWVLINACLLGAVYAFIVGLYYHTQDEHSSGGQWIDLAQFCMVAAGSTAIIMEIRRRRQQ